MDKKGKKVEEANTSEYIESRNSIVKVTGFFNWHGEAKTQGFKRVGIGVRYRDGSGNLKSELVFVTVNEELYEKLGPHYKSGQVVQLTCSVTKRDGRTFLFANEAALITTETQQL